MRTMLLSGVAALMTVSVANAADPVIYDQPLMSPQPIAQFDWSGFYAGGNAGYGGGTFDHPFTIEDAGGPDVDAVGSLDISAGGGLAGVQAGYNMQFNQWVVGAETDIQWSGINGELSVGAGVPGQGAIGVSGGTEVEWFGTIRGRVGFLPLERVMVYGTGGVAYGHVESSYNLEIGGFSDSDSTSDTEWGWTVGAGVEYAMTDSLSFKTEYLYTDLGSRNLYDGPLLGTDFAIDSDVKFHTVRAGVNFHF